MITEKISIITVCFNSERFIKKTIESVIRQKDVSIEYIIIDGGSTDNTINIIEQFRDDITLFISEKDEGIYHAMNKGLNFITGDWVCFMNSGDVFYENDTISKIFNYSVPKSAEVLYGDSINIFADNEKFCKALPISSIKYRMPFCHQASFVKKDYIVHNFFNTNYRIAADYDFFYNLYNRYEKEVFFYIPITVAKCDATDSISKTKRDECWGEYIEIRRDKGGLRWNYDMSKLFLKKIFGYSNKK